MRRLQIRRDILVLLKTRVMVGSNDTEQLRAAKRRGSDETRNARSPSRKRNGQRPATRKPIVSPPTPPQRVVENSRGLRTFDIVSLEVAHVHERLQSSLNREITMRCIPIIKVCTTVGRGRAAQSHTRHTLDSESDPAPSLMVAVAGPRRVLGDQDDDDQREQRQSDYPEHHLVREGAAHHLADQRARTYVRK